MAKAKVTVDFKGPLGKLIEKKHLSSEFRGQLGFKVVEDMKKFMASGQSPVKGYGRYAPYATQRKNDPDKKLYPWSVRDKYPGKNVRPVNLNLNNGLYDRIDYRVTADGVKVGHFNPSKMTLNLFEAHNLGMHPHVPQRKYLPTDGETFNVTIMRNIRELVLSRIKAIIRQK